MKRIFMLLGLIALMGSQSCQSHHEEKEEEVKFPVTNPLKRDTLVIREYVCQIHSISHIELRALERGYLESTFVDEGQVVKKGQKMFQIKPIVYEAEYRKAEAEVNFAEIEYQNTKSLFERNVVAPNELALAESKLNKAKAELALAAVHLGFTDIRAPFDGIVDHFRVRLGSLLEEGELLTTLSDNSEVWVYFNVPEAEYLDYKMNVKKDSVINVKLKMANNQMFNYPGHVTTIEADFNNETGNIAFRATFPNPEGLLRHGETGNIIVEKPLRNALLIPQKATFEVLDQKYAFVISEEGKVETRHLVIGEELPHLYAVTSGLKETDRILLEGLRKVRDGHEIKTEFQKPEDVLAGLALHAE